jgi:hypothetical protein
MRTNILLVILLSLFFGCSNQNSSRLTQQEQETIKKDIRETFENVCTTYEKGDLESSFKPYMNSENFLSVPVDGSVMDYQGMKKENQEALKNFSEIKFTRSNDYFRLFTKDIVFYVWTGKVNVVLKNGTAAKIDPYSISLIFEKINDDRRITYQQESGVIPAM